MEDMNAIINNSKLPSQLKEYFTTSENIKGVITKKVLSEIEDLYIYYTSLYKFDTSEFSAYTITSLKRSKGLDYFYFYLKKVIDSNLHLKTKDKSFKNNYRYFYQRDEDISLLFKEVTVEFCNQIDKVYKKNEKLNLKQTYISLGKLELINKLVPHPEHQKILNSGKRVLEHHENTKA